MRLADGSACELRLQHNVQKLPSQRAPLISRRTLKEPASWGLMQRCLKSFTSRSSQTAKAPSLLFWQKVQRARGVPLRFPVTAQVFQLFHEAWKHLRNAKAGRLHLSNFSKIVQLILRDFKRIFSLLCTRN